MRYASTKVDERLIPMMQCTRTFPEERTGDVKEGLARSFGLINIIHGCPSHTVGSPPIPSLGTKNSFHNSSSLFI